VSRLADTPQLAAEIEKRVIRPFFALYIGFPDPIYAWTGIGTIVFNGASWLGSEGIASIDTVGESTDGSATGVKAVLYRIPSELADHLADQAVRGVPYDLYVGALDETFQTVVGYKLAWRGTLQGYQIDDGGETLTVTASGESRMRDQRRPAVKRFSDEYQQRKYPGDRFFEYVNKLPEVSILWAKAKQSSVL
jgi:hypothetical protein